MSDQQYVQKYGEQSLRTYINLSDPDEIVEKKKCCKKKKVIKKDDEYTV